ncbi:cytochrome b561 and DOMON domain-containing protein At3g61750-like [Aristolochia californica]|uniref:cytochrome b561 and DOMON domain-containing protein At3g61750-like n=1 Tax=Aristolochia californica TaxID=171875 RepID=UPI0035DB2660
MTVAEGFVAGSRKGILLAVIAICFLCRANVVVAQTDTCGSDLSSFLPAPYSDYSNHICQPVWYNFILRYSQSPENVLTVILSAVYTVGWVGMGFSKDGRMVGSSAMVGWIGRDGKAHIRQYFLNGTTPSEVLVDKGKLNVTTVAPTVVLHGATIYLAFQLKFQAPLDKQQPLIFAFGTTPPKHHHLTHHEDKEAISFDFSGGKSSGSLYPHQLKRSHGVLAIFGWGVIMPIGAIVARYYKDLDPLWYYLHTAIQFVGFVLGLAAVVAGVALYDQLHANVSAHRALGIFVLSLSILQIIAFFLKPDKDSKVRRYWNWYHHWVGRLALFLASVNIVLGIRVGGAGDSWKVSYAFDLAVIIITVIVMECLMRVKASKKKAIDIANTQMNTI